MGNLFSNAKDQPVIIVPPEKSKQQMGGIINIDSETFIRFRNSLKENDGQNLGVVLPQKSVEKVEIDFQPDNKFTELELENNNFADSYYDDSYQTGG